MRFVLMSKLCRACFRADNQKDKLLYQVEIEKVRHHIVFEVQGEECACGQEDCSCNYTRISGLMTELEFACSDCLVNDEPLIASILEYFIRDERRALEEADAEYAEELRWKGQGRPAKVVFLKNKRK
jgi:hypothetical protein